MPFWAANFVLNYRKDIIPNPPQSFAELRDMCACPSGLLCGKFTYAVPTSTNYEAAAFIRNFQYEFAGGYAAYEGPFNAAYYNANIKTAFAALQLLEGGATKANLYNAGGGSAPYCANQAACDALYASGAIYMVRACVCACVCVCVFYYYFF